MAQVTSPDVTQELIGNVISQILTSDKVIQEIRSSFEQDAILIAEMGRDGNGIGSIVDSIKETGSGGLLGDDKIKKAVVEESWKIHYAGDDPENRQKRIDRVKELSSVMGFKIIDKIMNKVYDFESEPGLLAVIDFTDSEQGRIELAKDQLNSSDLNEEISLEEQGDESNSSLQECQYSFGDDIYDPDLMQLTNEIYLKKDKILEIIRSKAGEKKLEEFIIQYSDSISSKILSVNQISRSLKTDYDFGDIKTPINNMLKSRCNEIATQLTSGKSDKVAEQVFNAISGYINLSKNPSINLQQTAPDLIKKNIDNMLFQVIIEQTRYISEEIAKINEIDLAIETAVTLEGVQVSYGVIQATLQHILINNVELIRSALSDDSSSLSCSVANAICSEIYSTIDKAKFELLISGIITDNADEIAGRSKHYGPSTDTIQENVQKKIVSEIIHGYKRSRYMLVALADSIAHSIVKRSGVLNCFDSNLLKISSLAIKEIILENAMDIVGYGLEPITETTLQENLQKKIKERIAYKINQIYYNFNKSIVIQLEQRPTTGGSPEHYQLKLVENGRKDTPSPSGVSEGNISLSAVRSLADPNYICIKHTINNLNKTKASDIGGLRLYFGDKEVKTYDTGGLNEKSVFYQENKNEVSVYFYARTVNPLESLGTTTLRVYKTPLLFEYNRQFYKPYSLDQYLHKWVYFNIIKSAGNPESQQTQKLTTELDSINKSLNRIDLDQTASFWDTAQTDDLGGYNSYLKCYGIPYSGKDPPGARVGTSFYDRVRVWACVTENCRKQVHNTINKYQVGDLYLHGQKLTQIKPQSHHNQVSVYYDLGDQHFSRPLLLKLTSQSVEGAEGSPSLTKKWYKRGDLNGIKWTEKRETKTYESDGDDTGLKEELAKVAYELYATLGIELHKKKGYQKDVSVSSGRNDNSTINVNQNGSSNVPKADGYQCWEHQLSGYYNQINIALKRQQQGSPEGGHASKSTHKDPTFVLEPTISSIKLGIFTNNNTVAPLLTYAKTDYTRKRSLLVYFWKGDGGVSTHGESVDSVPLMFNFNGKYYGPVSKDKYFGYWQELVIGSPPGILRPSELKETLDHIYDMLNVIDLTQTKTYGLKCCLTHPHYLKTNEFNAKRVSVIRYKNRTHKMYVHTTVHKNKIGSITHSNPEYNFDQHTGQLGDKMINQVVVIYKVTGTRNSTETPVLVFLNQCNPGAGKSDDYIKQSLTHGYYKTGCQRGDATAEYLFCTFDTGCKIMADLIGQSSGGGNDRSDDQITPANSTCKGPCLNELTTVKCDGVKQEERPDDADILQVQEAIPKPSIPGPGGPADKDCETDSGGLNDSGCMGVGARVDTGDQGSEPTPGQTGPIGPQGLRCDVQTQQESQVQEQHVDQQHQEDQVQDLEASSVHSPTGSSIDQEIRDRGGNGSVPSDSSFMDVGVKGELSDSEPSTQAQTERTDLGHTSRINLDSQHTIIGGGDSKEHLPLEQHVEQPQQESQVQQNTNSRVNQEQLEHNGGVDGGHNGGGSRPLNPEREVPPPARGDTEPGISSIGFSESLTSDTNKTSGDVWQNIVEKFNEQPEVFYGSGAAVAGVGVLGTVGAVVYKKFIIVAAVAASGI